MNLAELRARHPRFHYRGFAWKHANESLVITFDFLLEPDITFTPTVEIGPLPTRVLEKADSAQLESWVFHLGLIELFSYWKAAAPAEIVVSAGTLTSAQLDWWQTLLIKGLGEFFYTNNIDCTAAGFVQFINQPNSESATTERPSPTPPQPPSEQNTDNTPPFLVPIGGGKDSSLVIELLEGNGLKYDAFLSFPHAPAARKIAQLSRAENIITLRRTFDPRLFELNKQGYLNGHTPFSARLAFESSLTAWLMGHTHIVLGNEFSANEGNVPFHNTTVNHQYSKTFEFEQAFRQYVQQYLSPAPEYFSLLRPLYELQIAAAFARFPRFHSVFKSCNRNQQEDSWCGECPKCLFVFAVLYPFLTEDQLIGPIFPHSLFEKEHLQPLTLELLGKDTHKPFECVGTYDETLAAFALCIKRFRERNPNTALPPVLHFIEQTVLAQEPKKDFAQELCFWNPEHHLSPQFEEIVRATQQQVCEK